MTLLSCLGETKIMIFNLKVIKEEGKIYLFNVAKQCLTLLLPHFPMESKLTFRFKLNYNMQSLQTFLALYGVQFLCKSCEAKQAILVMQSSLFKAC